MHLSSYYALLALGICSQVSVTLAGRGKQIGLGSPPAVCNHEPDEAPPKTPTHPRSPARSTPPPIAGRVPSPSLEERSLVEKRGGVVTYDENCNTPLPPASRYGPGFPTRKAVVVKAYADAVELARQASGISETSSAYVNQSHTCATHL